MVGSALVGPALVNACWDEAKPYRRLNLDVIAAVAIGTAVVRKIAVFHGSIMHQKSASKKPNFNIGAGARLIYARTTRHGSAITAGSAVQPVRSIAAPNRLRH
jgi:hypothetical protein